MAADAADRNAIYPVMSTTAGPTYTVGAITTVSETLTSPVINTPAIRRNVIDTGGVYATPIVLTAATSGSTYLLDDAAGLDFTLPALAASTDVGINYRFEIVTEVTSNAYRWTASSADLLVGHVIVFDKDAATADANALIGQFRPDLSNDVIVTITGTDDTQGSLVGGWLEFVSLTTARWSVHGVLIGDGSLATIFS